MILPTEGYSVPGDLLDFIRKGEKFLIAGHKEPDGDCLGSQIALSSALRKLGKKTLLCSSGPFKRTEIEHYESQFFSVPKDDWAGDPQTRLILIDCHNLERTGDLSKHLAGFPAAVIDHHVVESGEAASLFPPGTPCYIDGNAASTTTLVMKIILALGLEPDREESELLFFGLCTDTGYFRHVDVGGAETFQTAADLIRRGANPKAAYSNMHGGKSLDSRRLIGCALIKAESLFGGKLILSFEEHEEIKRFGLEGRDSDSLYQLFQSVAGVEAIALIRQETPEKCAVGLRSRTWVDVSVIASSFGGGGHKNAASASLNGTIAEIKPKVIRAFEKIFAQTN